MLIDETFEDTNGRKHRRYTVRAIKTLVGTCYSPYDKYTNTFLLPNADHYTMSRKNAWEYLSAH